jgi:hypothetical protein
MILARYIDHNEIDLYNGKFIYIGQSLYLNPSADELFRNGYKILVEEGIPKYDENTQLLTCRYLDTENQIILRYEVIYKNVEVEDDE